MKVQANIHTGRASSLCTIYSGTVNLSPIIKQVQMKTNKYKALTEYKTPYPDSIKFRQGEEVKITDKQNDDPDWQNWIWCEGKNNNNAWVPQQYLKIEGNRGILNRDYDAKELSIEVGEILTVFEIINGFAIAENSHGETGWTPLKCLRPVN